MQRLRKTTNALLLAAAVVVPMAVAPMAVAQQAMPLMAADADPSFDVVTIRPTDPGATSQYLNVSGRHLTVHDKSLKELLAVVYELQPKQIAGGPDWLESEAWDISGVPDKEGAPTEDQWKLMMKKMFADRFHLRFHMEKREMAAYVLSAPKGAAKLTTNTSGKLLPSFNTMSKPGANVLDMRNSRMQDVCEFMQVQVLDRPMVDETGIVGRYDLTITFMPDESQVHGVKPPETPEGAIPAPSLYTAMQEQTGLKLEPKKAAVPLMVIDAVDKPSDN